MGFQYDVNWGYVEKSIDLEADDYLVCSTLRELEDAVWDDCRDLFSVGDLEIDQAEMTFQLPQAFVDEWKSLKGLK